MAYLKVLATCATLLGGAELGARYAYRSSSVQVMKNFAHRHSYDLADDQALQGSHDGEDARPAWHQHGHLGRGPGQGHHSDELNRRREQFLDGGHDRHGEHHHGHRFGGPMQDRNGEEHHHKEQQRQQFGDDREQHRDQEHHHDQHHHEEHHDEERHHGEHRHEERHQEKFRDEEHQRGGHRHGEHHHDGRHEEHRHDEHLHGEHQHREHHHGHGREGDEPLPRESQHHHPGKFMPFLRAGEDEVPLFPPAVAEELKAGMPLVKACHKGCGADQDCHDKCPRPWQGTLDSCDELAKIHECHRGCGHGDHECHSSCPLPSVAEWARPMEEAGACHRACEAGDGECHRSCPHPMHGLGRKCEMLKAKVACHGACAPGDFKCHRECPKMWQLMPKPMTETPVLV